MLEKNTNTDTLMEIFQKKGTKSYTSFCDIHGAEHVKKIAKSANVG